MGFWANARELYDLLELKVRAGQGKEALREAVKEQVRGSAVQTTDRELGKALKKQGLEGLQDVVEQTPPGQQIRMTAAEYRKFTGQS